MSLNAPEIDRIVDRFGKANIFSFAVYDNIVEEDLFVLTKGIYIACMIKHIELPTDFEKHITIIEMEEDEEVPLNDPFAGNEGTSSMSGNIPPEEQENELSLYNFKLAGLISGKDYSYISIVNSGGEVLTLSLGQYLGKIQLVDLRLNEAIFKKEDGKYIIIDFNSQVREADDY